MSIPSARLSRCRKCACCRRANSRWTTRPHHFRQAFRENAEGDPAKSGVYKDVSNGIARPASSTTCRCSSTRPRRFDYLPADALLSPRRCAGRHRRPSGRTPARATTCCRATRLEPLLPPDQLFLADEAFFGRQIVWPRGFPAKIRDAASGDRRPAPPTSPSTAALKTRSALEEPSRRLPGRVLLLAESAGRRAKRPAAMLAERWPASRRADGRLPLAMRRWRSGRPLHAALPAAGAWPSSPKPELTLARRAAPGAKQADSKASFDNW